MGETTMRVLVKVSLPADSRNPALQSTATTDRVRSILADLQPAASYFIDHKDERTGLLLMDVVSPSEIPAAAKPWFRAFNATVEIHPTSMDAQDFVKRAPGWLRDEGRLRFLNNLHPGECNRACEEYYPELRKSYPTPWLMSMCFRLVEYLSSILKRFFPHLVEKLDRPRLIIKSGKHLSTDTGANLGSRLEEF